MAYEHPSPNISSEIAARVHEALGVQAERHFSRPDALFRRLPDDPSSYPGQAADEFFVPAKPSTPDEILAELIAFCPNSEQVFEEQLGNRDFWLQFADYVQSGHRIIPVTNHRMLPDVAFYKANEALILSQPELLGKDYFDISSLSIHKLVALFQYGTRAIKDEDGVLLEVPRSAVEVLQMFTGLDLVIPGTQSTRKSKISRDDKADLNTPVRLRWQEAQAVGGLITTFAGSGSEDWRLQVGNFVYVIQQTLSPGTIEEMMGEKTLCFGATVVFDRRMHAQLRVNDFRNIAQPQDAHALMKLIASQAEELSGERTVYMNDHRTLEKISKFRDKAHKAGAAATRLFTHYLDNHRSSVEASQVPEVKG